MLANVFTKTSRDRFTGFMIGTVGVALMLVFGLYVYRDIDISFYYELGPEILDLMGIPQEGDVAGLGFGAMYNLMGALTLAGLAISMGASAIAGEEAGGTLGLLLANPRSRSQLLFSKAGSMVALVGLASLALWGAGVAVPSMLQINMTGVHVAAVILYLFVNSLFYGMLALAIGAWTGRRTLASGTAVAVMMVSYLAAGILPLVESLKGLARIFPWYYFSGNQPVVNGAAASDIAVLGGAAAGFLVLSYVGVNRRDLRGQSIGVTTLDRLRAHPLTKRAMEKIAGSARVSSIAVKSASDHQGLLVITAAIMFYMGLMIGPIYGLIPDSFTEFVKDFPDAMLAMIGSADMSTPAGFFQAEIFSLVGPITFVVLTALLGSRALAGEEEDRTMDLLLTNPVSRTRVLIEKALAMVAYAVLLGLVTFVGTWAGVAVGGVDLSVTNIAATTVLLTLLGLVLGGVALLVGAATGRSRVAAYSATGTTVVAYFMFAFLPLSESFASLARWSPFHYYLGSDPLVNGMNWGHASVLLMMFVILVGVAIPLFGRRDLR